MSAPLSSELVSSCWEALRSLKELVNSTQGSVDYCSIRLGGEPGVRVNSPVEPRRGCYTVTLLKNRPDPADSCLKLPPGACFHVRDLILIEEIDTHGLSPEVVQLIKMYGPYCFLRSYAERKGRAVSVSHFAQSLDGRIATISGDSKWIGNEENLTHAHRMRALCDSILIGSGTLKRDQPKLTVRHVDGPTPVRIVLGSSDEGVESLARANSGRVIVVGTPGTHDLPNVEALTLESTDGFIQPANLLKVLYEKGIYSVYIEGGATTTSYFLRHDAIDVVQLHVSPMIFGSGVASFSLPQIQKVTEAKCLSTYQWFPVGDGVMLVGAVSKDRT